MRLKIALTLGLLVLASAVILPNIGAAPKAASQSGPPVQAVTSPNGLTAWLVSDQSLPIITIEMAWRGGSVTDPAGKLGLTYLLTTLLNEGAGDLDSQSFQRAMADNAISLGFKSSRDDITGTLRCLSKFKQTCFKLLKLALSDPRFDDDAVARMKNDHHARFRRRLQNPQALASQQFFASAFDGHPYANNPLGSIDSVQALTRADLQAQFDRHIARDNMHLAVVGDIEADELAPLMDEIFGALPATSQLPDIAHVTPAAEPVSDHIARDGPQTTVIFGFQGVGYDDPNYWRALILTNGLGGGSLSSILGDEVRNKRGLAYGVSTQLVNLRYANLWIGYVASDNKTAQQAMDVIQQEIDKFTDFGGRLRYWATGRNLLTTARTYLTGSYALNFDSGQKIANQLIGVQLLGFPVTYFETRNQQIEAVTWRQTMGVAKTLLDQSLRISSVGGTAIALPSQRP